MKAETNLSARARRVYILITCYVYVRDGVSGLRRDAVHCVAKESRLPKRHTGIQSSKPCMPLLVLFPNRNQYQRWGRTPTVHTTAHN